MLTDSANAGQFPSPFMLNPDLDWNDLAAQFAVDDRLRVKSVLREDVAKRLQEICQQHVQYELACVVNGENVALSRQQMAALSADDRRAFFQAMYKSAARGVGFLYDRFHLSAAHGHDDEHHQFLHEFYAFLNSNEMLNFISHVIGNSDIVRADGQATAYTPGHYLTRHSDNVEGQSRRAAYVFGFSDSWHPDWGGLLQFFEDDGTLRNAWMPEFNTLSLFDVRHIHSVTYITPFAPMPRLSVTGWFHATAPDA